jgi:rhodanese-related sulfurtransferase
MRSRPRFVVPDVRHQHARENNRDVIFDVCDPEQLSRGEPKTRAYCEPALSGREFDAHLQPIQESARLKVAVGKPAVGEVTVCDVGTRSCGIANHRRLSVVPQADHEDERVVVVKVVRLAAADVDAARRELRVPVGAVGVARRRA